MNIKKILMSGILILGISPCLMLGGEGKIFWTDNNDTVHNSRFVSESEVKTMVIKSSKFKSGFHSRLIINQGWGCLSLIKEWEKLGYKVIDDNTVILNTGLIDGVLNISLDYNASSSALGGIQVLGKKGCKMNNNRERWTAEQKIRSKWVEVASGVFTFKE